MTFSDYLEWVRTTFHNANENQCLKDEWQQCLQGNRSVPDYVTDLLYLSARILPQKSEEEIKEHFRTGLRPQIQLALAEHPEWDNLGMNDFIQRADRLHQIEAAKDSVRRRTDTGDQGRFYAITDAPRRGTTALQTSARPVKGSDGWKPWCMQNNACFNCGKLGHGARSCSQPRDTAPKTSVLTGRNRGNRMRPRAGRIQGKARA